MKYETACNKARQMARKSKDFAYVVYDCDETEYQLATEYDMDTFFFACTPIIAFDPYGDVAD
jgi:hypothetical protein